MTLDRSQITREGLRDAVTVGTVRAFRIFQLALMMGIVLLLGIALLFQWVVDPVESPTNLDDNAQTILIASIVHILIFVMALVVGPAMYRSPKAEDRAQRGVTLIPIDPDDPHQMAVHVLRTAKIMRLALLEGAALMGLIVCILAVSLDVTHEYPWYWLNAGSAVYQIAFSLVTLPNRESLVEELVERFGR